MVRLGVPSEFSPRTIPHLERRKDEEPSDKNFEMRRNERFGEKPQTTLLDLLYPSWKWESPVDMQ